MEFVDIVSLSSLHEMEGNLEMELHTLPKGKMLPLDVSRWTAIACIDLLELHQLPTVDFIQSCLDVPLLAKL
jgi:hypothetical protein